MITLEDIIEEGSLDPNNYLGKLSFLGDLPIRRRAGVDYYFDVYPLPGNERARGRLSSRSISIWHMSGVESDSTRTQVTLSLMTGHMGMSLRPWNGQYMRGTKVDAEDSFSSFPYVDDAELELLKIIYPQLNIHFIKSVAGAEREFRLLTHP